MRPVLVPGNLVAARLRSRTEEQLAHAEIELTHSRAPLLSEALAASAIEWVTALTASVLPEGQPYPRLYEALDALLALIEAAPAALGWACGSTVPAHGEAASCGRAHLSRCLRRQAGLALGL